MAPYLSVNGTEHLLDDQGYLTDTSAWNRDVASALAQSQEGLSELTSEHWAVIQFIRGYFEAHHTAPPIRVICKESGVPLLKVYELFPSGPTKGACKVAGLPRPDTCAD